MSDIATAFEQLDGVTEASVHAPAIIEGYESFDIPMAVRLEFESGGPRYLVIARTLHDATGEVVAEHYSKAVAQMIDINRRREVA